MRGFAFIGILISISCTDVNAQSTLLENVKRNPSEAIALCNEFKELNKKGISAVLKEARSKGFIK